jgi:hypothetical protein
MLGFFAMPAFSAEPPFKVGQVFQNQIILKGTNPRVIPLMPGKWEVTATREITSSVADSKLQQTSLFLVPEKKGDVVKSALVIWYPYVNHSDGWGAPRRCDKSNQKTGVYNHYLDAEDVLSGSYFECLAVRVARASGSKNFYRQGQNYINSKGFKLPPFTTVLVNFYQAGKTGEFSVIHTSFYVTHPDLIDQGKEVKTGPFMPGRIDSFPKRKAYVDAIVDWAKKNKSVWMKGFKNESVGPISPPNFSFKPMGMTIASPEPVTATVLPISAPGDETKIVKKLKQLKKFFESGLITETEYTEKKRTLLEGL